MKDLEIILENKPGALASMGELLGRNNISLEGGGAFQIGNIAIAHFLVEEAEKAKRVLGEAEIKVIRINDVIIQKLRQDAPGQLGMFCKRLAEQQVNILTQYSDHSNQLIVVVDDQVKGKAISEQWEKEWWS